MCPVTMEHILQTVYICRMFKKLQRVLLLGIIVSALISLISLPKVIDSTNRETINKGPPWINRTVSTKVLSRREKAVSGNSQVKVVIITAYQHSGSSFLGSIFDHHPLSIYFYEPVAALYMSTMHVHRWQSSIQLNYLQNGSRRMRTTSEREMLDYYFQKMSDCELASVPPELCPHIWLGGRRTKCTPDCTIDYPRDFQQGMAEEPILRHTPCDDMDDLDPMKKCYCRAARIVKGLEPSCKKMRLVVMKLLRYELNHMINMTLKYPNWYLVHQVRDPRGLVNSHVSRRPNITQHKVRMLARKLCGSMADDIVLLKRVQGENKGRVFTVRYEDLAMHPNEFASKVYERIEMDLPSQVQQWIQSATRSRADEGKYRRANSSMTAVMWKKKLPELYLSAINEECESLYKYFENTDSFFV